jgi:hypothetical protein
MGTSYTTREDLSQRSAYRRATGSVFAFTAAMNSKPISQRTVHESLDPKRRNTRGEQIRECLDSPEHPTTLPVVVGFDETGSMGDAPRIMQQKLGALKGATLRMGLVDAQLCFAAYGDAHNHEAAPCQVGQFESGIEMEDWLNNLYLEGNGGGNNGETSGLLLYFLANFARLDSLTKRGKKGYLILTGDECPLRKITREEVKRYIGTDIEADLTIEQVVTQAKKSFDIYFFLVETGAALTQGSLGVWQKLLGKDHVIIVESLETISEQIALLLAQSEGVLDSLDAGADILVDEGADRADVLRAAHALVPLGRTGTVMAKFTGTGSLPIAAASGSTRRL